MKKAKILFGALAIFAAINFVACNNSTEENKDTNNTTTTIGDSMQNSSGEYADTTNNMNNGGNYAPDERKDNRGTDTVKSPI